MELLINNRDYELAKAYLEKYIDHPTLSESSKNTFIELYNNLNVVNAKDVYLQASKLFIKDVFDLKYQMSLQIWWVSAYLFIFSSSVYIVTNYTQNFFKKETFIGQLVDNIKTISIIGLFISPAIFFAGGFT